MNDEELVALYTALLEMLRTRAPWVAAQIEETVREGRPVARQVRRGKSGAETVALVVAPQKLRDDQFAATEELTARERASIALHAVERLLVDPPEIEQAMRETMSRIKVQDVLFAEPTAENALSIEPYPLTFLQRQKLVELLGRVMREVASVG
jgi:hypothetical protein